MRVRIVSGIDCSCLVRGFVMIYTCLFSALNLLCFSLERGEVLIPARVSGSELSPASIGALVCTWGRKEYIIPWAFSCRRFFDKEGKLYFLGFVLIELTHIKKG